MDYIEISNLSYLSIESLKVKKAISSHSTLEAVVSVSEEELDQCTKWVGTEITVTQRSDKESKKVFCGKIESVKTFNISNEVRCRINAISASADLDKDPKTIVFQNAKQTEKSIAKLVLQPYSCNVSFPDEPNQIEHIVLQYQETDWQFLLRLAEGLKVPIISNDVDNGKGNKYYWFGFPDRDAMELSENDRVISCDVNDFEQVYQFYSESIYSIGDKVEINGSVLYICDISFELYNDFLRKKYSATSNKNCFLKTSGYNIQGLVLTAKVLSTDNDGKDKAKIQVQFDIEENKEKDPFLIQWVTSYSNENGGLYSMPDVDSQVCIVFCDNLCTQYYAEKNLRNETLDISDTSIKRLKVLEKEILIDKDKIQVVSAEDKVSMQMDKDSIQMLSGNTSAKMQEDTITLSQNDEVTIQLGKDGIKLSIGDSSINLKKDSISLAVKNVKVELKDSVKITAGNCKAEFNNKVDVSADEIKYSSKGASIKMKSDIAINGSKIKLG